MDVARRRGWVPLAFVTLLVAPVVVHADPIRAGTEFQVNTNRLAYAITACVAPYRTRSASSPRS